MSNTDRILNLIRATPYKWPTFRIANELNIPRPKVYASCKILEKYGLVSHRIVQLPGETQKHNFHTIWFRKVRA